MDLGKLNADWVPRWMRRSRSISQPESDALATPSDASTFAELLEKISYLSKTEQALVRKAWRFADEAHLGQTRASGQPYITHPIAVAGICADWRLDVEAIMAALTHDSIEDCNVTKSDIIENFSAATAELVDGLTKLDKLQFATKEESQAESFRKMLLAIARDIRVILIKLADRLHNMRTMDAMANHKRARIARETLDIYAPIARQLGLNRVFRELSELSFDCMHPWRSQIIVKAMKKTSERPRDIVKRVHTEVERAFISSRMKVVISGREKDAFSVYKKMRSQRKNFANISDLFGFRIITDSLADCYTALGILHMLYKPVPERFKDYIALQKINGYQSLHTTLIGPLNTRIEFQIRTGEMHLIAEKGIAAHWAYKTKGNQPQIKSGESIPSIQSLLEIQNNSLDALEFFDNVKGELYSKSVRVLTPKNIVLTLPEGATPVDFAYAVHSDLGNHCVAARVNDEAVPLRTRLENGDRVEIIRSPSARPDIKWLDFVRSSKARLKIRNHLRNTEAKDSQALGLRILTQALNALGYRIPELTSDDSPQAKKQAQQLEHLWAQTTHWAESKSREDLLIALATGRKIPAIVAQQMAQTLSEQGQAPDLILISQAHYNEEDKQHNHDILQIDGSEGTSVQIGSCCNPIPGDPIVGYLGRGESLMVHHNECHQVKRNLHRERQHWLRLEWSETPQRNFETAVTLWVQAGTGRLAGVFSAISQTHVIGVDAKGSKEDLAVEEIHLRFLVKDRVHLADILRNLRRLPFVHKVIRLRGQILPTENK